MCSRITCSKCGKPTFAGCGMHVEQVLGNVPKDQRCKCHEEAKASKKTSPTSAKQPEAPWWKGW